MTIPKKEDLMKKIKEFTDRAIDPMLEGKEKGDMTSIYNKDVTLADYTILMDKMRNTSYSAFCLAEYPETFFFGGQVVTELLNMLETSEWREAVRTYGIKVRFVPKKSKNGRIYTDMEILDVA